MIGLPLSKLHILMFFTPPVTKNSPVGEKDKDRILLVILFEVIRLSWFQAQMNMPLSCSLPIETRYWLSGEKAKVSIPYLWPLRDFSKVACFGPLISQIAISGCLQVPSPVARYLPFELKARQEKTLEFWLYM